MIVKMTSKRQVTFPKKIAEQLQLRQGDALHIIETPQGILIRPHRFLTDKLAPLRHKISAQLPSPQFDKIRHAASQHPRLRD